MGGGEWGMEGNFRAHELRAVVETQIPSGGTETCEAARSENIHARLLKYDTQVTSI